MKWLAMPVGAILLLLAGALTMFLATPVGSRLIAIQASSFVTQRTESQLLIEDVSGTVAGTLCAGVIVYQQPGLELNAANVCANVKLWSSVDFFRVDLAELSADTIDIQTDDSEEAVAQPAEDQAPSPSLPVNLSADSISVGEFKFNQLRFNDIQATVDLENDDLSTAGSLRHEGLSLALETGGDWAGFELDVTTAELAIDARLNLVEEYLPFSLKLQAAQLDLEPWTDRALLLRALSGSAEGNLQNFRFSLRTEAADAEIGTATLDLKGTGNGSGLELSGDLIGFASAQLDLSVDATALNGRLSWSPDLTYQAQIQPQGVRAGLSDFETGGAGNLQIKGDLEHVQISGELSDMNVANPDLAGSLNPEAAAALSIRGPNLSLASTIRWSPLLEYDAVATARALQVVLDGRTLTTSGDWQVAGHTDSFAISARGVDGFLDDEPLSAGFDLARSADGTLTLTDARLQIGSGTLAGSGRYGTTGNVQLTAAAEDFPLALLHPQLSGVLTARASIEGPTADPAISAEVSAESLRFDGYRADQAALAVEGRLHSGELEVSVQAEDRQAEVTLAYDWQGETINLHIATLAATLEDVQAGPIQTNLKAPATLQIQGEKFELGHTCVHLRIEALATEAAEICGSLSWPQGPLMLSAPAALLPEIPLLDGDLIVAGGLSANIAMRSLDPLAGKGSIRFEDLQATDVRSESTEQLGNVAVDLSVADERLVASISSPPGQPLQLHGNLSVTRSAEVMRSDLTGNLDASLQGIWIIESLLPMDVTYALQDMRGQVALAASVTGTLEQPLVNGEVSFTDAGLTVPAVGVSLSNVNMAARLHDSDQMTLETRGSAGGGAFSLTGELTSIQDEDRTLTALFTTEAANLVNLPDYTAWAAGELTLEIQDDSLRIGGDVAMPKAFIRINEVPDSATVESEDAAVYGEETSVTAQQLRTTNLNLTLGDDVRLQAFGLDTFLEGNLQLIETPGNPPQLLGTITLREGLFAAYGQELKLARGVLTFSGSMQDPVVDIIAEREVSYDNREYLITLQISGTALALTTNVRSTPSLPESDVLALLITGRTFSEVSASEQSNVYGAALALGLFGMTGASDNVASRLNLEEIILDQDNAGNLNVGAAVRLNRDLYLRYTYGALSRLGGVLLRYRLTNRFSVQAQTGDTHSIEIRYGVDN